MIILDTDHVSLLQWEGEPAERLRQRLQNAGEEWIAIVNDALLLTANARDFEKVPGLRFDSWLD